MQQRIRSLQGLRGWAIIMIVLWHLNSLYPGTLPKLGDRGVEFFLFISGFLIARKYGSPDIPLSFRDSSAYVAGKIRQSFWLFALPAIPVFLLDVVAGPVKIEAPFWQLLSFCSLTQPWIPDPVIYGGVTRTGWFFPLILYCYFMTPVVRKTVRRFGAMPVLLAVLGLQTFSELLARRFLSVVYYEWLIYVCPAYRILDFTLGFCAWHLYGSPEPGRRLPVFRTPDREDTPRLSRSADLFFAVLLLAFAGLSLLRPVQLKYVLFHPVEIALLLLVVSEKSALSNVFNRNRFLVRLGNLSRFIFYTHLPAIRLTGMVWRRIFGPGLPFPQWIASLIAVMLAALAAEKLAELRAKAKKKGLPS